MATTGTIEICAGIPQGNCMTRDIYNLPLDLGSELIIDNFAGCGTSTGLEQAFGRSADIAINHAPEALAMHAANRPPPLRKRLGC